MSTATLLICCRDRTGLVAAISQFVFANAGNILESDQHSEVESGLFFMRLVWSLDNFKLDRAQTHKALGAIADQFGLQWELTYSDTRPRVAILGSKTPHCLYDLLLTNQLGELGGDIVLVMSNHESLRSVAEHFNVRFACLPVTPATKQQAETAQQQLLEELKVDLIVLARYMQVLSEDHVKRWHGRIINIHHSFLPAFVGAKPYHQAKERGVKIIGATAHYVTADLDQGPIIDQDVARVSHCNSIDDMISKGRNLERQVLTRAVQLHLQRRVLISGKRTIVFS
jgi:formyltetrahydrofolate deformylase